MSVDCGCGCGGHGGGTSAGCGCGGGATDIAVAGAGFVRPRFFGGMLLTEDDLQAVVDYAVAKRRLTNRSVIGAGVVCGLGVRPHPCDRGVVVVSPGYAIDCCGDDLLVSCPEDVDIIALVRELRQRTGTDCGEPCEDQPRNEYHLYLKYVETPTAPVAPYAPDDCATGECEFSRITEGYTFELRCDGPEDVETLIDVLKACRPPEEKVRRDAERMAEALQVVADREAIQMKAEEGAPTPKVPSAGEYAKVLAAVDDPEVPGEEVEKGVQLIGRSLAVLSADAAAAEAGAPAEPPNRRELVNRMTKLATKLRTSKALAAQPPAERDRILRVLKTAEERSDLSKLSPIDRGWLERGTSPTAAEARFVTNAEELRGVVLEQLATRGESGSPAYREATAMKFSALSTSSATDALRLAKLFLRSVSACTCSAFNPPCPTCVDDGVALAKIRVDGCDVVDICELDRRWVLSPRALGYWFPIVETLRERLEEVCCPTGEEPPRGRDDSPYAVAETTARSLEVKLAETRGDEATQKQVEDLQAQIDALTQRMASLTPEGPDVP